MKEKLSALMDGELDDKSAAAVIEELGRDPQAAQTWRTYQLISDAMRESQLLSADFAARLSERLDKEPTVLAPRAMHRAPQRWFAVSAAASVVAAVGLVGWLAFAPQPQVAAPVAQAVEQKPNIVPMPTAANDYLLAHQGFSPRLFLQGMAPYVRTVSEQTVQPRAEPSK
jgi:sigma-E factor negative regulatory protein RseA